jgi:dihydrodipicolinate synthase/N-acetylneuraminate lyase
MRLENREDLMERFRNVFAFPPTPFMPDDLLELNEEGYRRNIRFLVDSGVKAAALCAGTGEIRSLSTEEIKRSAEAAIDEARGDCLLVPSLPPNVKQAVEIGRYVEKIGAEAVLVFPPEAPEDSILDYHRLLSRYLRLGFMVYPMASRPWSLRLYRELAEIENVVAVKDEISDVAKFERIVREIGERVVCICKKDHETSLMRFYYMVGAEGFCGGTIAIVPRYELGIHEAAVKGDWEEMRRLQRRILPLTRLRARTDPVGLLKAGLDLQGLAGGPVRPPRRNLTEKEKEELREILRDLGAKIGP